MKKIFFILSLLCLGLSSCDKSDIEQELESNIKLISDAENNCLVVVRYNSSSTFYNDYSSLQILICNENGKAVGHGTHWGSYYVPYNGTITISWKYSDDDEYECTETIEVGTAHEIKISISGTSARVINVD